MIKLEGLYKLLIWLAAFLLSVAIWITLLVLGTKLMKWAWYL